MKITLKLQDHHRQSHPSPPLPPSSPSASLLLRAKIPIEVFNLPFLSHFSTTTAHPSDLSLSLSTNFSSGPSLKLSYSTATAVFPPLSLTLKSGTGVFGSPINSPLIISAHFSFAHSNPTFSLLLKPQFGSFSLRKSIHSHAESIAGADEDSETDSPNSTSSSGFVPVEGPAVVKHLLVEKSQNPNSIFKGIQMAAITQMPVAKSVELNFRWWMDFAEDQMPVLRINKIGIRRVSRSAIDDDKKGVRNSNPNELQMLKGMCFWMKRELDVLTRVNRDMKGELEELKSGHSTRVNTRGMGFREDDVKATPVPMPIQGNGENPSSGFKQWRSKRKGGSEESGKMNVVKKEEKTGVGVSAIDVENELQRAIKAATGAQ